MDSELLPFDILLLIAETEPWAWRLMTTAIPSVARYSLNKNVQIKMKKRWTTKEVTVDGDYTQTRYLLPNGKSYREEGPAFIKSNTLSLLICREEYYTAKPGKLHRGNDKPAVISQSPTDNKTMVKKYYKNGVLHRDGEHAALLKYYEQRLYEEKYYIDGKLHRDGDYPALHKYECEWERSDTMKYYKNGELHRDGDHAAIIKHDEQQRLYKEKYYKNGKLHRDGDNPAHIEYYWVFRWEYHDETIIKRYYENGVYHGKLEEFGRRVFL